VPQCNSAVTLGRVTLNCRCHVCAFFSSREDEYDLLLPFIPEGLGAGDRAIHILDEGHRGERMRRLREGGINTDVTLQSGLLEMRSWENAYLRGARFDQNRIIDLLRELGSMAGRQGSGATRLWANMEWAVPDFTGTHDIIEYESRLNDVLPSYNMATVCTYDLTKFSASLIMDVLRTHPQAIVGGTLQENPFYIPPVEFLHELRARDVKLH
jgi:hypothetical protein